MKEDDGSSLRSSGPPALFEAPEESDLSAAMKQLAILAWLHAEAVWQKRDVARTAVAIQQDLDGTLAKLHDARELNATLRAVLADAVEGMEDMIGYVGPYFREKWDHDGYIARAKAALGTQADPSPEAPSEASMEGSS